ncbi:DNA-binding protein [Caballeronia turbans]|jgi:competence ComEA-like helix-hairpin-helix protein|uniref:ComEA family DNA-binding protein n=1 Tax=unclassified Caballeronia TaxID=2646786 RepID=UPI00074BDDFF|nr:MULTISPECIES: helix-hairpin-helix domain-containing protein [unclassified Caballeronia]SAL48985.1 DNA-binding protein [Caballeronia turbans]
MLKKLLMLCIALMLSMGAAFAAVDVNTADQAALEAVKGLGPVKSKAIIDERTKNGPFKDADDLATRVKGLGTKSVATLEQNGLTIGGSSLPPTGKTPKPATTSTQGGSAAPNSTVKSSAAATGATSPAATTAQTPATAPAAPASGTKASKKSKKESAAAETASASGPSAASDAKPAKSKRSKKDKAASAAAASQ